MDFINWSYGLWSKIVHSFWFWYFSVCLGGKTISRKNFLHFLWWKTFSVINKKQVNREENDFFFRSTKCFSERLVLNKWNVTCSTNHRKLISNHKRIFPMVTSLSLPPFFLPQTNHWLLFTDCWLFCSNPTYIFA